MTHTPSGLVSPFLSACRSPFGAIVFVGGLLGCGAHDDPERAANTAQAITAAGGLVVSQLTPSKCMDISDPGDTTPGGNRRIIQRTCNGSGTQQWSRNSSSQIVNPQTGLCLNAEGGGTANGTLLIAWPCSSTAQPNEKWVVNPQSSILARWFIQGEGSGRCVNIPQANTADGVGLILWDCVNASNNLWSVRQGAPIVGLFGKCLDVDSSNRAILNTCSGLSQQDWVMNSQFQLVNNFTGTCLNVQGGGSANGTPIIVYPCTPTAQPNEIWSNQPTALPPSLNFQLRNQGKCLNVPGANQADGTPLILWPCTSLGVPNDTWSFQTNFQNTIKVVAIACSDDNGANGPTIAAADLRATLNQLNTLYRRAGIQFTLDDAAFLPENSTLLNGMGAAPTSAQDQAARNLAAFFSTGMTIILTHGAAGGVASQYSSATDYVVMPNTGVDARDLAYAVGAYFSLSPTFYSYLAVTSLAAADNIADQVYNNGGMTLQAFEADQLADTPPDPGIWVYEERSANDLSIFGPTAPCLESDQIVIPNGSNSFTMLPDRRNSMSFFKDCPTNALGQTISAQQIGRIESALASGFRTQLVRN